MMRSLYSGVTGLRNHQTRMDVIGNNIANVNTVGFKASRVTFQDVYSETIRPGSASNASMGGTNPMQIGLGMSVQSIEVMHGRSAAMLTNMPLDLSIAGDGFFVVSNTGVAGDLQFTRAGNFHVDAADATGVSNLLDANGNFVMGWHIPTPAGTATTPAVSTFAPTYATGATGAGVSPAPTKITIDTNRYQNISVAADGSIQALDTDKTAGNTTSGTIVTIGFIAVSTFSNPAGLEKAGGNTYIQTPSSGQAKTFLPGAAETGAGKLQPGTLEMSNVDIAEQFTDMIVTQRGFQANSRVITTSDQMLEELVNIKR